MTKNKFSTLVHPVSTQQQNLFLAVENEINTMSLNLNHCQRYVHLVYQNSYNYLYFFNIMRYQNYCQNFFLKTMQMEGVELA